MKELTFHQIVDKLQKLEPFHFARVGDGEMMCMAGKQGKNCDDHKYFVDLGQALRTIYKKEQDYFVGLQPVKHGLFTDFDKYPQQWCNADVLHDASIKGWMPALFHALSNRNVVMIGNHSLAKLNFINVMVEIPKKNAWQKRQEIWSHLKQIINEHFDKKLVLLFSAGMMSGVLIDEIANNEQINRLVTTIDTGSLFDPYVGKATRSYHKQIIERENAS